MKQEFIQWHTDAERFKVLVLRTRPPLTEHVSGEARLGSRSEQQVLFWEGQLGLHIVPRRTPV